MATPSALKSWPLALGIFLIMLPVTATALGGFLEIFYQAW
jgi:hypothetical protein